MSYETAIAALVLIGLLFLAWLLWTILENIRIERENDDD